LPDHRSRASRVRGGMGAAEAGGGGAQGGGDFGCVVDLRASACDHFGAERQAGASVGFGERAAAEGRGVLRNGPRGGYYVPRAGAGGGVSDFGFGGDPAGCALVCAHAGRVHDSGDGGIWDCGGAGGGEDGDLGGSRRGGYGSECECGRKTWGHWGAYQPMGDFARICLQREYGFAVLRFDCALRDCGAESDFAGKDFGAGHKARRSGAIAGETVWRGVWAGDAVGGARRVIRTAGTVRTASGGDSVEPQERDITQRRRVRREEQDRSV